MTGNWDDLIQKAGEIVSAKEGYYKSLGYIAWKVGNEWGPNSLKDFADEVKGTFGIELSYKTLENFRWVYGVIKDLDLPEDMSYRTLQYIAGSNDPKLWAKRIKKEGLSSPEVYHLLREESGLIRKKVFTCKYCGKEQEI